MAFLKQVEVRAQEIVTFRAQLLHNWHNLCEKTHRRRAIRRSMAQKKQNIFGGVLNFL